MKKYNVILTNAYGQKAFVNQSPMSHDCAVAYMARFSLALNLTVEAEEVES